MRAKIGVALSGGGMRGLAHLGVLQVLEENHVPVDVIAGTSMGGLVAGLYAAGVPLQELIDFGKRVGVIDLAAPDLRWRGLFGHKKLRQLLVEFLGQEEITFEDLQIPAAVIAADIETGEMIVLDAGPLIPALMATCALPILFSPVHYRGRWLVDGGVLNNLPVDVVRSLEADRVLGVSVPQAIQLGDEDKERTTGLSIRGLRLFGDQTPQWKTPFLIAGASMNLAIQLVNQQRLEVCPPDLLIQVRLTNVGLFGDGNSSQVINAGRQAALDYLPRITRLLDDPKDEPWVAWLRSRLAHLRRAWSVLRQPPYPMYPEPRRSLAPGAQQSERPDQAHDEHRASRHKSSVERDDES